MELEVELYDCVINGGLGRNHLLKKKKGKYLFYVESNGEHYVICDAIYGEKDHCSFSYTQYYSSIESALKGFDKDE